MTSLFILGSSRGDGHTARLVREVWRHIEEAEIVDLAALSIGPYDYAYGNRDDDFLPVAQKMVHASRIIFASPLYWYSMSGQMKIFFDRLTDLTDPPLKPLGKALAGKAMFAIGAGGSPTAPDSFTRPFADTAGYFNMEWGGLLYARGTDTLSPATQTRAKAFAETIARLRAAA